MAQIIYKIKIGAEQTANAIKDNQPDLKSDFDSAVKEIEETDYSACDESEPVKCWNDVVIDNIVNVTGKGPVAVISLDKNKHVDAPFERGQQLTNGGKTYTILSVEEARNLFNGKSFGGVGLVLREHINGRIPVLGKIKNTIENELTPERVRLAVEGAKEFMNYENLSAGEYLLTNGFKVLVLDELDNPQSPTCSARAHSLEKTIQLKRPEFFKKTISARAFWLVWTMINNCFEFNEHHICDLAALEIIRANIVVNENNIMEDFVETVNKNASKGNMYRVKVFSKI